ncbi:MAG TPA: hypothetical protein VGX48_23235 [Pyrinomonadaceae bacterium]|jgi:hypothetical protein|nr:hypothetical protein [Pyrinomonadaceae bacterium]
MTTLSSGDFLNHATSHLRLLQHILSQNELAQRQHASQMKALEQARDQALDELTAQYLPSLTPETVAAVPALTGYGRFETDSPFEQLEKRRRWLSERVVTAEADERYQRREQLLDPVAGELTLKLAEAEKQLKFFDESLKQYEDEPGFRGLIERGYDTDAYTSQWWELQYYRDWKYGDLITEKFEQERFRDVAENYVRLRDARDEFRNDFDAAKKQKDEVEALVNDRAEALAGLENLEAYVLEACRRQLREHLEYIDREELATRAAARPELTGFIKRLEGIEKKMEYLDELVKRYLHTEREQLIASAHKLSAKVEKYSRPKHAYTQIPVEEANRWLKDPTAKVTARRRHFNKTYQRVYEFDRYDAFDYARDMLWWDLMTDGRIDGDFIPEVYSWREQHPGSTRILQNDMGAAEPGYLSSGSEPGGSETLLDVS